MDTVYVHVFHGDLCWALGFPYVIKHVKLICTFEIQAKGYGFLKTVHMFQLLKELYNHCISVGTEYQEMGPPELIV